MRKLVLLCLLLTACKKQGKPKWIGVPQGVTVSCSSFRSDGVGTCVGGGQLYTCINVRDESGPDEWHYEYTCAATTQAPPAEAPTK